MQGLNLIQGKNISIHALREEGDGKTGAESIPMLISIHALREEGDLPSMPLQSTSRKFLSTPSARRATSFTRFRARSLSDFYPRPPRGGRPLLPLLKLV